MKQKELEKKNEPLSTFKIKRKGMFIIIMQRHIS